MLGALYKRRLPFLYFYTYPSEDKKGRNETRQDKREETILPHSAPQSPHSPTTIITTTTIYQ